MAKYEARGNVPEGKVQRKFYFPEVLADILRIEAAKRNESQSSIVERALRKELGLMIDRDAVTAVRMTPDEAWEGFVGSQGVDEFLAIARDRGQTTPEDAVAAYLDESYEDLVRDIANPISRDALEDLLLRYIEANMPTIDAVDEHGWGIYAPAE